MKLNRSIKRVLFLNLILRYKDMFMVGVENAFVARHWHYKCRLYKKSGRNKYARALLLTYAGSFKKIFFI